MANAVSKARQASDLKRRFPVRANARNTVETIFEATARILEREGLGGLNTNRIAETAGVSIGALYGYFPNKHAILLAMARRELDLVRDRVIEALTVTSGEDPVRLTIRALIKGYGVRNKARRILMERLFADGGSDEMARPTHEVADLLMAHQARFLPPGAPAPSPISLFILTRAVDSVVRAATYEDAPYLGTRAFEDELVRLVNSYLIAAI